MSIYRPNLRAILPAAAVMALLLASSARASSAWAALCGLAICVLLADGLAGVVCKRLAPRFAQLVRLCSAAAMASMGWSWLSATQLFAGHTSPVPILVVLALMVATPMTDNGQAASAQDGDASTQDGDASTQDVAASTRDATQ